jgi:hypothetical protein
MFQIFLSLILQVSAQEMPFAGGRPDLTSIQGEASSTPSLEESRASVSVPVFKGERTIWSAQMRGSALTLDRTRTIADRSFEIPKQFGEASLGGAVLVRGEELNQGGNLSVGSSGRSLWDEENSRFVSANYFAQWKYPEGKSIYFFMSYSNNRSRFNNIPLPGVAYGEERETLRWMVGFPFAFANWTPGPWRINAFGSPFGASAQAGYVLHGPWQGFASWGWSPRAFQNLAPDIDHERLLYEKKEWSLGAAYSPAPPISVSVAYLYQYDRRIFIGESASRRASSSSLIRDEGGVQIKARFAF